MFTSTWGSITQNPVKYGSTNVIFMANGKTKAPNNVLISVADTIYPKEIITCKINIKN